VAYPWMVRKTVLKQLLKLLPLSVEMQTAVALTDMHESGLSQGLESLVASAATATERGPVPQTINVKAEHVRADPASNERDAAARHEAGLDDEPFLPGPDTRAAAPAAPTPPAAPAQGQGNGPSQGRLTGLSFEEFTEEEFSYLQQTMRQVRGYNRAQLSAWLGQYDKGKQEALAEANILKTEYDTRGKAAK